MEEIFSGIKVTEDDIKYAERILFGNVNIFDKKERRPIIEDFQNSFDVNACPGSGKTTVLLAKLIILSRKMPLDNGKGICVLTHTNVAIDEIKNKLGDKSDILFKYPNYFGTIQNFVDKYLTIPYFKKIMNEHIKSIDDDIYCNHIRKLSKENYPKIDSAIQYSIKEGNPRYTNKSYEKNFENFITNKHFDDSVQEIRGDNDRILKNLEYYSELKMVMADKTLYKGILRYEDAYCLARRYLERFPIMREYFSSRFGFVFMDEMQDVDLKQMGIINKIFNNEVITQRFGDVNQSISKFSCDVDAWIFKDDIRTINSSKRYGEGILKFLEPLRINKKLGKMKGNKYVSTLNPHVIIYDDATIELVIETYIELLDKYNVHEEENKKVKIIGKIGMSVENPNKSISSYVKEYSAKGNKKISIDKKIINKLSQIGNTKEFYEYLIYIIRLSITINGRVSSKEEFIKLMEDKYNEEFLIYRSNILEWTKKFKEDRNVVLTDIVEKTEDLLQKVIEIDYDIDILKCNIRSNKEEVVTQEEVAITKEESEGPINLDNINTIMGTKGETHKATLYLESKLVYGSKDLSDISRILDYMVNKKDKVDEGDKEALMNAYVAMSRAEKLTCIAIQYDTIKGRIKEFEEYGYKIIGCNKEINRLIEKDKLR